jgi:acetoacetate decarboxylase
MNRPDVDPTGFIAVRVWSDVIVANNEARTGQVTSPFYADNAAAIAGGLEVGDEYLDANSCVRRVHLPKYANNAAAVAGGLSAGDLYLNTTDDATGQVIKEVT